METKDQTIEPLACPFCGAKPHVREAMNLDGRDDFQKGVFAVICANFDETSGCDIMPRTAWQMPTPEDPDARARAIRIWNRRVLE